MTSRHARSLIPSTGFARETRIFATWALLLGAVACGSSPGGKGAGGPSATATAGAAGTTAHAIHLFVVGSDGVRRPLDLGPATEVALNRAGHGTASATGKMKASRLHPLDDPGIQLTPPPTVDMPGDNIMATAWALVYRAAVACGSNPDDLAPYPWGLASTGNYAYFVYNGLDNACSGRLLTEQNLLCIADKLAAIGDAVGTVVLPATPPVLPSGDDTPAICGVGSPGAVPVQYGTSDPGSAQGYPSDCPFFMEWDIPPQADGDRFVIRDLAIHTLGVLATADSLPTTGCTSGSAVCACSTMFAQVAGGQMAVTTDPISQVVFGVPRGSGGSPSFPSFPPSALPIIGDAQLNPGTTTNNSPTIARSALQIEAQILRGGGRLLHDLVRRDTYSDMATASQQAAQALDPDFGNKVAWGLGPQGPYGTYAHAARVIAGRWEVGNVTLVGDPACQTTAINLLPNAYGSDLSARIQDRPIQTKGEALAVNLVEQAGIVLPTCSIAAASGATLRSTVVDQLLLASQLRNGQPVNLQSSQRTLFQNTANSVADAEIAFGYAYVFRTFRLLTDSPDIASPSACVAPTMDATGNVAGLQSLSGTAVAASVTALKGVVVGTSLSGSLAAGLPRSLLTTDSVARSGGMLQASGCSSQTYWTEWGTTSTDPAGIVIDDPVSLPREIFQDAFHMGQAFERRLALLRNLANPTAVKGTDPAGDPEAVARGALAELSSWAGSALVHVTPVLTSGHVSAMTVRMSGYPYSHFGIPANATAATVGQVVPGAIGFVYGPPWVAECAIHARTNCPPNFDTAWVQHPTSGSVVVLDDGINAPTAGNDFTGLYGAATPVFTMNVPYAAVAPVTTFAPPTQYPNPDAPQSSHLYMVLIRDLGDPMGLGKVLGVVPQDLVAGPGGPVSFAVAPMQRELLDALSIGNWVGAAPARIGDSTAAETAGYCVDGVPRNVFVPLQNELTSDDSQSFENSWKHYLSIAQTAANTADSLAEQIIQENLAISERAETADQQLTNICGDFGAVDEVSVDNGGNVSVPKDALSLSACLNEPTTDIVFMAGVPTALTKIPDAPTQTSWLKTNILHCPATPTTATDPLCTKQGACSVPSDPGCISFDSLHLTQYSMPGAPFACDSLPAIVASKPTGFHGTDFRKMLSDGLFSSDSTQGLAAGLQLNVDTQDNWTVMYGDAVVMDSVNPAAWPGCLLVAGNCTKNNVLNATTYDRAFRYCPGADPTTAAPGCDGGDQLAEWNMLKWRVSSAMWAIGAAAGGIPAGMFNMPIPAGFPNLTAAPASPAAPAQEIALVWYPGLLQQQSTAGQWSLVPGQQGLSSADVLTMGTLYNINSNFTHFPASADNEITAWYGAMYQSTTPAATLYRKDWTIGFPLHVLASNSALIFPNCSLSTLSGGTPFCSGGVNPARHEVSPAPITFAQIVDASGLTLDGLQCTSPFAGPVGTPMKLLERGFDRSSGGWDQTNEVYNLDFFSELASVNGGALNISGGVIAPEYTLNYTRTNLPGQEGNLPAPFPTGIRQLPPSDRVFMFARPRVTYTACGGVQDLVGAAALACSTAPSAGAFPLSNPPPAITTVGGIGAFEQWLNTASRFLRYGLQQLYAEKIPVRVINDFAAGQVGSGDKSGSHGSTILDMEQALQTFTGSWSTIAADLDQIRGSIEAARLGLIAAHLQQNSALYGVAMQRLQVELQMAQSAQSFLSSLFGTIQSVGKCGAALLATYYTDGATSETVGPTCGTALTAIEGTVQAGEATNLVQSTDSQELKILDQEADAASATEENQVALALNGLSTTTPALWANIQTSLANIRAGLAKLDQSAASLQLQSGQAAYEAAVGTGSDFVTIPGSNGQQVPIPVNTVLRRQASGTEIRYGIALQNAKALAYMARRAIEERIGVPLNAIATPVGPLDAPASWADDICSLTGINYQALSTATPSDAGGQGSSADQFAINQFASSFVGDYVSKLSSFVDYFNVQYPSHEGDDTAVLSLRSDLLTPDPVCTQLSPNLLLNSGRLDEEVSTLAPPGAGWMLAPCSSTSSKCLAVLNGSLMQAPLDGPEGLKVTPTEGTARYSALGGGVTWLTDLPAADAGAPDAGDAGSAIDAGATVSLPTNTVSQFVNLASGSYVLSWWDQGRDSSGALLASSATPPQYVVSVLDSSLNTVAQFEDYPYVLPTGTSVVDGGPSASYWSSRRALSFSIPEGGSYWVAFGASSASGMPGSVAIADVQLEAAGGANVASPYVATTSSRLVVSNNCPASADEMRAAFVHGCDSTGRCYYDLTTPLVVDTEFLNSGGGSSLAGKLAQGNYNYRNTSLALNLVGTGVRDCTNSPTPDCFGTGYVEYNLEHDGTSASLTDYNGKARVFNFGIADVQHGKALAAERYITMPLGTDDQALLAQPGIQHIELRGRPLDGVYRLRIWDSPALNWNNLQDVQIVLNYRYWSEIVASATSTGAGH
jgi:hypothetical protein